MSDKSQIDSLALLGALGDVLDPEKQKAMLQYGEFVSPVTGGTFEQRLEYPFYMDVRDGQGSRTDTVDVLQFRRPLAGDLDLFEGDQTVKKSREAVARLTGIPERIIAARMDARDFQRAGLVIQDFFPTPPTGS